MATTMTINGVECKLCRFCGQPMKPKGVRKKPNEYDHARGCPYQRTSQKRKQAMETGYTVTVSQDNILSGLANRGAERCFTCPVALALQRATGDNEARVIEAGWTYYLVVWSRWHPAPLPVRAFIRAFDDRKVAARDAISFVLPPVSDPAWKEECYRCRTLYEDGVCPECRGG